MKHIVLIFIALACIGWISAIEVSGNQSGVWEATNNPYQLVGDVNVLEGSSLQIMPGVVVQAMGNFRINAHGTISAIGTLADSIRFVNAQNPLTNLWKGLRFENPTLASELSHCYIEYAEYGVNAVDSPIEVSNCHFKLNQRGMQLYGIGNTNPAAMNIHHNIVEYSRQNGILIPQNSNAHVHHNEVRFNGTVTQYYGAIQLSNQSTGGQNNPIIEHNFIHDNYKQGITAWDVVGASAINPTIRNNIIQRNLTGIYLLNASGYVAENQILDNYITGDMNSGAGVMVSGVTSLPYFEDNIITGNYTGFYITNNAMPVLGDLSIYHSWAQGGNLIANNVDANGNLNSVFCASYPNSGNIIKAENNDWGAYTTDDINLGINDHTDSAALPLVDFDPWLLNQSITTLHGSYSYNVQVPFPLDTELILLSVTDSQPLAVYPIEESPFSIETDIQEPFRVLIHSFGMGPMDDLWAMYPSYQNGHVYDPSTADSLQLHHLSMGYSGIKEIVTVGQAQMEEGREIFPVIHNIVPLPWHRIDYLYQEGDYLYIVRSESRIGPDVQVSNFPIGTVYDKFQNFIDGESWSCTFVEHGMPISSISTYNLIQLSSTYEVISRKDMEGNDIFKSVMVDSDGMTIYRNRGGYNNFSQWVLTDSNPILQLQTGNTYQYISHDTQLTPHDLLWDVTPYANSLDVRLTWQAPRFMGEFYSNYQIFQSDNDGPFQMIMEIPFWQTEVNLEGLSGDGFTMIKVRALADGGVVSGFSNEAFFYYVANEDQLVTPASVSIYPNPTYQKHGMNLEIKGYQDAKLSIYNLKGQLVHSASLRDTENYRWNLLNQQKQKVSSGVYFIRIDSANNPSKTHKILILK